jgi:hypothetical protein
MSTGANIEKVDAAPAVDVNEAEYRRLLGYPRSHPLTSRAVELSTWARQWFAEHGRPWIYWREATLRLTEHALEIDGIEFQSQQLHDHLRAAGAQRVMLLAVSAGRESEEHARALWQEGKPDEYFFLEVFASAVVEHLVARTSGRICDLAEHDGQLAIPHYSPGYSGWDVIDQNKLFALITGGAGQAFAGPLEVLSSGMLKPKKSLLAVIGLAPRNPQTLAAGQLVPCRNCSFSPCQYRRAPYRHGGGQELDRSADQLPAAPAAPRYSVNPRALRKWATERVTLEPQADGSIEALFRFDGTTCSHQPLAFDYRVRLSGPTERNVILGSSCQPAPDDEGHKLTCSYLADAEDHLHEIAAERPLVGRPLDEVFEWSRESASAGCHCTHASRAHKWGLAFEAIHFALAQSAAHSRSPES